MMNCGLEKHPMLILDPLDAENHLEVLQLSPWMWKIGGLIRPLWSWRGTNILSESPERGGSWSRFRSPISLVASKIMISGGSIRFQFFFAVADLLLDFQCSLLLLLLYWYLEILFYLWLLWDVFRISLRGGDLEKNSTCWLNYLCLWGGDLEKNSPYCLNYLCSLRSVREDPYVGQGPNV